MLVFQADIYAVTILFFRVDGQGFMYLRVCLAKEPDKTLFTKMLGMSNATATPLIMCMMSVFCGGSPKVEPDDERMTTFFRTANAILQGKKNLDETPEDEHDELLQAIHVLEHASHGLQHIYEEATGRTQKHGKYEEDEDEVKKRAEEIALKMKLN